MLEFLEKARQLRKTYFKRCLKNRTLNTVMTTNRILTTTEYLSMYHILNSDDRVCRYLKEGVLLFYRDKVMLDDMQHFKSLGKKGEKGTHLYETMFLPLKMFRIIETKDSFTLCRIEELGNYIKV